MLEARKTIVAAAGLVAVLCVPAAGQVHWQGRYNGKRYNGWYNWDSLCCNDPRCEMRQDIIKRLQAMDAQQSRRAQYTAVETGQHTGQPTHGRTPDGKLHPIGEVIAGKKLVYRQTTVTETYQEQYTYCTPVYGRFGRVVGKQCHVGYRTKTREVPKGVFEWVPVETREASSETRDKPAPVDDLTNINTLTFTELRSTPQAAVDEMLRLLNPPRDATVYDLGCGDGRILITAAVGFGCKAVGVELNPESAKLARENAANAFVGGRVEIIEGDAREADVSEARYLALYLYPDLMAEIIPRLPPGAEIASFSNKIPGLVNSHHSVDIDGEAYAIYTAQKPPEKVVERREASGERLEGQTIMQTKSIYGLRSVQPRQLFGLTEK